MISLRDVNRSQFSAARRYWSAALGMKLLIFVLGAWAIFVSAPVPWLPQLLLALALGSALLQLRSDGVKSRAEALLRTLDVCTSFGREISTADKRDIIAGVSKRLRRQLEAAEGEPYFDSDQAPGPEKAVRNLIESAWYTKRQAQAMAAIYGGMIAVLLAVSLTALVIATRDVGQPQARERIVRLVTAWLLLLVSLEMLKNVWAYWNMYQRCQSTETACEHLAGGDVSEADALRRWYEYQVARASSPLLPSWLWRVMQPTLNDAWRSAKSPSA